LRAFYFKWYKKTSWQPVSNLWK